MQKRRLREIADKQYGYFTAQQAVQAGYARHHHTDHVRRGNWRAVERGLFRLPDYPDTQEGEFIRWSFWAIGRATTRLVVVSHESALAFYGLRSTQPQAVHLTLPGNHPRRDSAGCVIHIQDLPWSDFIKREGFHITTPMRTLLDMKPSLMLQGNWVETIRLALNHRLIDAEAARALAGESVFSGLSLAAPAWAQATPSHRITVPDATIPVPFASASMDREKEMRVFFRQTSTRDSLQKVSNRSFTLIEMLVVITIISILASLLMPSLRQAMSSARVSACANNMKQVSLGFITYANQTGGWIPPVFYQAGSAAPLWADEICRVGLGMDGFATSYNIAANEFLSLSQLGIWYCPENASQTKRCGWNSPNETSYGINGWDNWETDTPHNRAAGVRVTAIRNPSELYQMLEAVYFRTEAWYNTGADVIPTELQGTGAPRTRYPHLQGMNILYVDGHLNYTKYPLAYRGTSSGSEWYHWYRR